MSSWSWRESPLQTMGPSSSGTRSGLSSHTSYAVATLVRGRWLLLRSMHAAVLS